MASLTPTEIEELDDLRSDARSIRQQKGEAGRLVGVIFGTVAAIPVMVFELGVINEAKTHRPYFDAVAHAEHIHELQVDATLTIGLVSITTGLAIGGATWALCTIRARGLERQAERIEAGATFDGGPTNLDGAYRLGLVM